MNRKSWLSFFWPPTYRSKTYIIRAWKDSVSEPLKRRLTAMGLISGQTVELLLPQNQSHPSAFVILRIGSTTLLSLRPAEWSALEVQECPEATSERSSG